MVSVPSFETCPICSILMPNGIDLTAGNGSKTATSKKKVQLPLCNLAFLRAATGTAAAAAEPQSRAGAVEAREGQSTGMHGRM